MKKITLPILFALLAIVTSSAQISCENLKRAIERVPIVVEGEIVRQSCFQDERTGDIFTKNYLLPKETFKGLNSMDTIIFLTSGGKVDDIISTVSHSVQVNLNQTGIFLISQSQRLSEFYEISSYIKRLPYDRDYEAYFEGSHEKFPSWRLLREDVGTICEKDVAIKRITFSDLQTLDIPEFCVKLENASLDVPTQRVSFDVMAKSSIAGLEFARAEIPLKYPTALLGTNIVLNDRIEASKGIVITTSFYDISMYDVQEDEMVLAITSSCNGGESAFILGTEYEKIADVSVDVETLGNLGSINPDDFEVEGLAKYFLDGVCQEFVEKCAEGQVPLVACIINEMVLDPAQIASGIGQFVEIKGDNFTTSPIVCQMVIPDADDGGMTNIYASGVSQLFSLGGHWTDINIKMNLSSTVNSSSNLLSRSIGSGQWEIRPPSSSYLPCSFDIEIDYNLFPTVRYQDFRTFGLPRWKATVPDGKRHWNILSPISPDLAAQGITISMLEDVAKGAFCDWETVTGIDFKYDGLTTTRDPDDRVFTVYYDELNTNVLMDTKVRLAVNQCSPSQKYFWGWIVDGDIAISTKENWFVNLDESLIPVNKYDLYSVLIHEIGHSLGLCHAMDLNDINGSSDSRIMYYGVVKSQIKREVDSESSDGVNWLIDKTNWSLSMPGECFPSSVLDISTVPINSICYGPTSLTELEHSCDVKVNSQFASSNGLEISLIDKKARKVSLLNIYGQIIYSTTQSGSFKISTNSLPKGMYFLQVSCDIAPQLFKILIQ